MKFKYLFPFIAVVAIATITNAQEPNTSDLKKVEMKKLDKMVGQWNGTGWIQKGPKRETFSGTESVLKKLDGLALLIEGRFVSPEGKVIHETLAAMSFDDKASIYKMRTYLLSGISGEYDLKIAGEGFEWGFSTPTGGTVRYKITITPDTWTEAGEFSRDGKTWMPFFEMKLSRSK